MKLRYHSSCSTISIYSFDKVVITNDYRHLVVGWDELEDVKIDQEEAQNDWFKIYNEYVILSNDNKITLYYKTLNELSNLKIRRYAVKIILDRILTIYDEKIFKEYVKILRQLQFHIDKNKPLKKEVARLRTQLKGANNRILMKENELKNLKSDEKPIPLMKQVVQLEEATGRNLIDPKLTSVEKWIFIMESANKSKAA